MGFNPALSKRLIAKTAILPWILSRISAKDHDDNRSYASEILSIILQDNRDTRLEFAKKDGVEITLKVLSQYRKRDPVDAEEGEFMENVFDALCSALAEPEVKKAFLDSEGVDLMVLLMKCVLRHFMFNAPHISLERKCRQDQGPSKCSITHCLDRPEPPVVKPLWKPWV